MNRAAVAVGAVSAVVVAALSTALVHDQDPGHRPAACPTVGQAVDGYVSQIKSNAADPSLDFTGCNPKQQAQRLADMQLIIDRGGVQ